MRSKHTPVLFQCYCTSISFFPRLSAPNDPLLECNVEHDILTPLQSQFFSAIITLLHRGTFRSMPSGSKLTIEYFIYVFSLLCGSGYSLKKVNPHYLQIEHVFLPDTRRTTRRNEIITPLPVPVQLNSAITISSVTAMPLALLQAGRVHRSATKTPGLLRASRHSRRTGCRLMEYKNISHDDKIEHFSAHPSCSVNDFRKTLPASTSLRWERRLRNERPDKMPRGTLHLLPVHPQDPSLDIYRRQNHMVMVDDFALRQQSGQRTRCFFNTKLLSVR